MLPAPPKATSRAPSGLNPMPLLGAGFRVSTTRPLDTWLTAIPPVVGNET